MTRLNTVVDQLVRGDVLDVRSSYLSSPRVGQHVSDGTVITSSFLRLLDSEVIELGPASAPPKA